ncbi:MAG: hypothetical protein FJ267_04820 [Planctomycetes bacterium]|nr:hypothetical protein [Planctomycetota bacterium]
MIDYEEMLIITRCLDENGMTKYDYYLSNAQKDMPLEEFARMSVADHRVEEAIKRSKSQAGLSDYEVRNWKGWYHHQILSLIATLCLTVETHREKNGRRQSPFHRSEKASRCFCVQPIPATHQRRLLATKDAV